MATKKKSKSSSKPTKTKMIYYFGKTRTDGDGKQKTGGQAHQDPYPRLLEPAHADEHLAKTNESEPARTRVLSFFS